MGRSSRQARSSRSSAILQVGNISELKKYAVRLHRQAAADIEDAYSQIASFSGTNHADDWQDSLRDVLVSLATLSRRYSLAGEIAEDDQDGQLIHILHIRHGARKPMTRAEARKIEADA